MNYTKSSKAEKPLKKFSFPKINEGEITRGILCAATSFLLGICPLPMSVYPLGIAFFCAASQSAPYAFVGLAVSSFFTEQNPVVYILSAFLALFVRVLVRIFIDSPQDSKDFTDSTPLFIRLSRNLFSEAFPLRAACAAVSAFTLSLHKIVTGGFRYYDLFGAILAIAASALGVLLFGGALKREKSNALYSKSARIAISALICLSLASLPVRGFEPALTAAFILTLSFCLSDGLAEAGICALLCGAVCGIEDVPVLAVALFAAYCVFDISPMLASAVACIAGSVCGVLISGSTYMTSPFLSLLFGCTLYSTQKKLAASKKLTKSISMPIDTDVISRFRLERNESLLALAQSSFGELSGKFPHMKCAEILLESVRKETAQESEENIRLEKVLSRRLYELGFGKTEVIAIGKRDLKIILSGERLAGKPERTELIRRQGEDITGFPLARPSVSEDGRRVTLLRDSVISYHHACAHSSKENICGDTSEVFFDKSRNYLYALICDGMGSGKAANSVSSLAASILKALLLGGLEAEKAIGELIKFLPRSKSSKDEISTTVDLMRIDLYTGDGILIKSGAAPSYIKRGNEIIALSARTIPVGILNINDAQKINFSTKENDVIIMTSDGVAECESDGRALVKYLKTHRVSAPKEMAAEISELARSQGKEDDISVIAIKIFPQNY